MTKRISFNTIILIISLIFILLSNTSSSFAAKYPTIATWTDYGTHTLYSVRLTKKFTFNCEYYGSDNSAFITAAHTVAALPLHNFDAIYFAGKHKGRYFFNRNSDGLAKALYSWKPGETRFTKESDKINIDQFKKYNKIPWSLTAAKVGKYVTASKSIPLQQAYRYRVYIYNLENGKKKLLDKKVFGVKRIGKKIYYVKANENRYHKVKSLTIKKCNPKSKKRFFVKTISLPAGGKTVYTANLTKHYIKIKASGWKKNIKFR